MNAITDFIERDVTVGGIRDGNNVIGYTLKLSEINRVLGSLAGINFFTVNTPINQANQNLQLG